MSVQLTFNFVNEGLKRIAVEVEGIQQMRRLFTKIEAGLFVSDLDYNLWAAGFTQTIAGGALSVWLRGFSTAISAWLEGNVLSLWIRISKPEGLRGVKLLQGSALSPEKSVSK